MRHAQFGSQGFQILDMLVEARRLRRAWRSAGGSKIDDKAAELCLQERQAGIPEVRCSAERMNQQQHGP